MVNSVVSKRALLVGANLVIASLLLFLVIFSSDSYSSEPNISKSHYGYLSNGESIEVYALSAGDLKMKVITYGGIITELWTPDRQGQLSDIVLGYDNLADYEFKNRYFGAIVGRFANRIKNGQANINGSINQLSINKPPHQLHGGTKGFDQVVWKAYTEQNESSATLVLSYLSSDGEEGYPGNLLVNVKYTLTSNNELNIEYKANSDEPTILNLTQHSYFNLAAKDKTTVLNHKLKLYSDSIAELGDDGLPTGNILKTDNTALDFSQEKIIGLDIFNQNKQLQIGKGYDHYWLGYPKQNNQISLIAELSEPNSGRFVSVWTTKPGVQVYTANYLNKSIIGKYNRIYAPQFGICLETGQYPNSPAEDKFPTYILNPSDSYYSNTQFKFGAK